jgi:transposase
VPLPASFGEDLMLALSANTRIFLCREAVDMRNGFEGLSGLVESIFAGELTSGAYFVFLNWKRDRMKVLYWDVDGLAIWYKRLEKGSFPKRKTDEVIIERKEFFMLLEGIVPKRIQKRFRLA